MTSVALKGRAVVEPELASVAFNGMAVAQPELASVTLNGRAVVEPEIASIKRKGRTVVATSQRHNVMCEQGRKRARPWKYDLKWS